VTLREYEDSVSRVDYRSNRSPSVEGSGNAVRARDLQIVNRQFDGEQTVDPAEVLREAGLTDDLIGFWLMWHITGGFEAQLRLGQHPATVWRKIRRFRMVTGQHPDDFRLEGVTLDLDRFWTACSDTYDQA
jgi:hypothetical protein